MKLRGFLLAALAAALYGTNPVFAVPLYSMGLPPIAVLFFRYLLGLPLLALILISRGEGIALKREQYMPEIIVGVLMAVSSLTLYQAYLYVSASVASTLLFMYPVLTALIMTLFFKEKLHPGTVASLILMSLGLYLLSWTAYGLSLNHWGIALVFISSITYAIYLVAMRVSPTLASGAPLQSLLWQLLAGGVAYLPLWALWADFALPQNLLTWLLLAGLALLPTILSLFCTLKAISLAGPTATAIFGALEPVTAVCLSSLILGESLSSREIAGGILIILATLLVLINTELEKFFRRIFRAV